MNNEKILCLGNNSEDTDIRARLLADQHGMFYHGLITEVKEVDAGCYQTSFYDMSYGDLIELSKNMNKIIILDQPIESYIDEYAFHQTVSLGKHLKSTCNVIFLDESLNETIEDILKTNKSICILPFIQSVIINDNFRVCCRSNKILSKNSPAINYSADVNRNVVKQKMLAGDRIDDYCKSCYNLEDKGITSPRITETVEWANRLDIKHITEFTKINKPVYYEIRASNQCNLMCRMCSPKWSSLIEKENQKSRIFGNVKFQYTGFDQIDIDSIERLYVAGGEPTIMPELYKFLEDCIEKKKTNFEILVNTNAASLNKKFKFLLKHFTNFNFVISVDGYGLVNQYTRWPTNWNKLVSNIDYIHNQGHHVSFNSVVSIYNISSLFSTVEFLSNRYEKTPIRLALVSFNDNILSPYIFPNKELVITDLTKIKKLDVYQNDLVLKSKIDEYLNYFTNCHVLDLSTLTAFFKYNDNLDNLRGIKLLDFIPDLEQCREKLNKDNYENLIMPNWHHY